MGNRKQNSTPIGQGVYRFQQFMPDGTLERCTCQCEILSQGEKTIEIRLLAPNVNGHRYGDVIRVHAKSVSWKRNEIDCTNEWWNNN